MRVLNLGRVRASSVPEMSKAKTLELGSQLVSEMLLMSLASAIAANEYRKMKRREEENEEQVQRFLRETKAQIQDYERTFVANAITLQRIKNAMERISAEAEQA